MSSAGVCSAPSSREPAAGLRGRRVDAAVQEAVVADVREGVDVRPTWPPVTMISLAAEPPSGRTMSPCRRISVIRKPGWLGEHGIPVKNGWPSSISRTPPRYGREEGVRRRGAMSRSVVMSALLDGDRWLGGVVHPRRPARSSTRRARATTAGSTNRPLVVERGGLPARGRLGRGGDDGLAPRRPRPPTGCTPRARASICRGMDDRAAEEAGGAAELAAGPQSVGVADVGPDALHRGGQAGRAGRHDDGRRGPRPAPPRGRRRRSAARSASPRPMPATSSWAWASSRARSSPRADSSSSCRRAPVRSATSRTASGSSARGTRSPSSRSPGQGSHVPPARLRAGRVDPHPQRVLGAPAGGRRARRR